MKKIRFATIGTSKITDKFLSAASACPQFEHGAVFSRNEDTAKVFAARHHVRKYYTDLDALAGDPEIDAVYIAVPNAFHCARTLQMLNAGKHVLCEKPLASNFAEAEKMVEAARRNHLVLMEAMRSLTDPGMEVIRAALPEIAPVRRAVFSFCQYSSRYDHFKAGNPSNIFSREMSAGALMDIGIYCIEPLLDLFGEPEKFYTVSVPLRGDIDGAGTILAQYADMTAELIYSKICDSDNPSEIQGERGTIYIDKIAAPHSIRIRYTDGTEKKTALALPQNNMAFETQAFICAICGTCDAARLQDISVAHGTCDAARLRDISVAHGTCDAARLLDISVAHGSCDAARLLDISLRSMKILDEARRQISLTFPADGEV